MSGIQETVRLGPIYNTEFRAMAIFSGSEHISTDTEQEKCLGFSESLKLKPRHGNNTSTIRQLAPGI